MHPEAPRLEARNGVHAVQMIGLEFQAGSFSSQRKATGVGAFLSLWLNYRFPCVLQAAREAFSFNSSGVLV